MAIMSLPDPAGQKMYTPPEDTTVETPEGLTIQITAGQPMSMAQAVAYGLVPDPAAKAQPGPSETKEGPRKARPADAPSGARPGEAAPARPAVPGASPGEKAP